jgi:hypothetical protein
MFDRPVYNVSNGQDASSADLYPVIYQTSGTTNKLSGVNGFAAPCAVCQAPPTAEFVFTNVGRFDCPGGFKTEYNGYLMASAYNAYATDYTCIDQAAQTLGAANSLVGANLYLTEVEGGAHIIPG